MSNASPDKSRQLPDSSRPLPDNAWLRSTQSRLFSLRTPPRDTPPGFGDPGLGEASGFISEKTVPRVSEKCSISDLGDTYMVQG
eukprot:1235702-Rhodomonas_salina.2